LPTTISTSTHTAAPTVVLVGVDFGAPHFDEQLLELGLLAQTAGMQPVARLTCRRKAPDSALFVGSGKAEEIRLLAQAHGAQEVLFDQQISPVQQRNLESLIDLPVNDRTLLILEIFAQRARSHEGKLQVELARLQYLSTRLVRRWTHLERQQGGIGGRGGPGETQIEIDRRLIGTAIARTKERLEKVKRQRQTQRRQRSRRPTFDISLVGYTNSGKSTLFNALTHARAYAADQLFATLDTTTRQLWLGGAFSGGDNSMGESPTDANLPTSGRAVSLSDTVGFIRDLPHGLVEAFEATLQEAAQADLLLHVVDAANPSYPEQMIEVDRVLAEIGAQNTPQLLVFNKLDVLPSWARPRVLHDSITVQGRELERVFVSAATGDGIPQLRAALAQRVAQMAQTGQGHPAQIQEDAARNAGADSSIMDNSGLAN
jgi:GTP-binding protein HflX